MINNHPVYKTTKKLLQQAKADGEPIIFVVQRVRRNGWLYNGYYIWESGGSVLITSKVDKIVTPGTIEV